jgi:hypothetical protein
MGDRRPGFVPGLKADERKWGHAPRKSPMSTPNPHADLIGFVFPTEGGEIAVTGPCSWSDAYVDVATPQGPSVRNAAQVRRRKELG